LAERMPIEPEGPKTLPASEKHQYPYHGKEFRRILVARAGALL
jgi:hypothetical protein